MEITVFEFFFSLISMCFLSFCFGVSAVVNRDDK